MSEQQNRPLPVHLTSGSNNACSGENVSFQGGIEPIRENPTSVRILQEFRHIYEERLRNIDEEMGSEGMELKLKTLTSWITDLGEQNLMLVETVEQLEREAAGRVSLLEERLKKSSHVALEYMSKLEEYDHKIWNLSEEKGVQMVFPFNASNGLMQVQQTEEILKTRVSNLQNDISCLLELIQRAWYKGSWDTNGLNFLEVTFEDIFGPHSHQVPGGFLNPVAFDGSVFPKNNFGNPELNSASWKEKSTLETVEMKDLTKKLEDTNSHLQKIMKENECLVKEIEFLSAELKTKTDRIATLSQNSFEVDKNELEYRIMDLEATYLRLERSWDHAWEQSKNGTLDDLIYYQNALEEKSIGDSKSCAFEMPEKTICNGDVKKDQERIRELCGEIKALLKSTQQSSMKRGVSFASPSKEDYKLQVQELQKALKQAQNVAEIARKKITRNNECVNDEMQLARHIEESRVNVVLAQAAIEEAVEELEVISSVFREKEEKISELEILIQELMNTLKDSHQDINLKTPVSDEEKVDVDGALILSYQSKVQMVSQLMQTLKNEYVSCDEIVGNGLVLETQLNAVSDHENIPSKCNIKKINMLLEELSVQEKEVSQRYLEMESFQGKIHGMRSQVQDVLKKIEEYICGKESASNDQEQSELKVKKLLLELESVQDDLEQCLKTFEPTDISNLDIE